MKSLNNNTNQSGKQTSSIHANKVAREQIVSRLRKDMQPLTPFELFKTSMSNQSFMKDASLLYRSFKKFHVIKKKAIKAIREGKIFIIFGQFSVLRNELVTRGWVEKIINDSPNQQSSSYTLLKYAEEGNQFERMILSNLISDYPADFVFSPGTQGCMRYVHDFGLWNRILMGHDKNFTRKDGLCRCIEESQFYLVENKSDLQTPRAFVINSNSFNEFNEEYQLTLYRSLIYLLNEPEIAELLVENDQEVSENIFDSSLVYLICEKLQQTVQNINEHSDIEIDYVPIKIDDLQWSQILTAFSKLLCKECKILVAKDHVNDLKSKLTQTRKLILQQWPTTRHDGYHNLWIWKPPNLCGGNGITLLNSYEDIMSTIKSIENGSTCIIQKYIETPLLIYNTKFDIRYFFLVTIDGEYAKIWDHKSCYLRFSSQQYDLGNLEEQVHLTNHTVQQRYKNGPRNDKLPSHNMWHLHEFQEYLASIGKENVWTETVHPAIKRNLVGVVSVGVEEFEMKSNRYQIFGADFLITNDFDVYLLEVNNSPALATNTTVVTEVIFKNVLLDTVKVVLDYPKNHSCDTGGFKLIHKQQIPRCKGAVSGMSIFGKSMNSLMSPTCLKTKSQLPIKRNKNIRERF